MVIGEDGVEYDDDEDGDEDEDDEDKDDDHLVHHVGKVDGALIVRNHTRNLENDSS